MSNPSLAFPRSLVNKSSFRVEELSVQIENHFNKSLSRIYPEFNERCEFVDMDGKALELYDDDYLCSNVVSVCGKLRDNHPSLFLEKGTNDIAKDIINNLPRTSDIIRVISIREGGLLTFRLSLEFIIERIELMLCYGLENFAPIFNGVSSAVVHAPTPATDSNMHADIIRSSCIKETIAHMLMYSGVRVSVSRCDDNSAMAVERYFVKEQGMDGKWMIKKRDGRRPTHPFFIAKKTEESVEACNAFLDLQNLWLGTHTLDADQIIYVAPLRQREYVERCFAAAKDVKWLKDDGQSKAIYCGYRTSSNERKKLACLLEEFRNYSKAASLVELGKAAGYCSAEAVFECSVKYTYLKDHRLSDFTWSIDEVFNEKGNTFVFLLHTQALVRSIIQHARDHTFKFNNGLVDKERKLGLHLIRFTEVIKESVITLLPHMVCEYLKDLCEKFTSCYSKVRPFETRLTLCQATALVMEKCFHLLRITPDCSRVLRPEILIFAGVSEIVNQYIPFRVSEPRLKNLNPRIEMFSLFVGISYPFFQKGNLSGTITIKDIYGLQYGWTRSDTKHCGYVTIFDYDWCSPRRFKNGSIVEFGNPSSQLIVPFDSLIELDTDLLVTSKESDDCKEACFELSRGTCDLKTLDFCKCENIECRTESFGSRDGAIEIYYILLRDAIDTSMELSFESPDRDSEGLQVRGDIFAYYGKGVVKDYLKMYYKAVIFHSDGTTVFPGHKILLNKPYLAVPAKGELIIEASLQDCKSGETLVEGKITYPVENKGSKMWKMSVPGKEGRGKKGKKGKKGRTFNLTVKWSKGSGIFS